MKRFIPRRIYTVPNSLTFQNVNLLRKDRFGASPQDLHHFLDRQGKGVRSLHRSTLGRHRRLRSQGGRSSRGILSRKRSQANRGHERGCLRGGDRGGETEVQRGCGATGKTSGASSGEGGRGGADQGSGREDVQVRVR